MAEKEIAVVGLATMGMNLARNLASHGVRVAVYNRTRRRTDEFMEEFGQEADFQPAYSFEDLARILKPPRASTRATPSSMAATPSSRTRSAAPPLSRSWASASSARASRVGRRARCTGRA